MGEVPEGVVRRTYNGLPASSRFSMSHTLVSRGLISSSHKRVGATIVGLPAGIAAIHGTVAGNLGDGGAHVASVFQSSGASRLVHDCKTRAKLQHA